MELALTLFPVLPVAIAAVAVKSGSRLAIVSFVIFAAQLVWLLAYRLTDWISNPGMSGVWLWIIYPTAASLIVAAFALALTLKRKGDLSPS